MDGDVAPLDALVETGARVIVDEAHATGVIGAEGRGLVHELGLQDDVITSARSARRSAATARSSAATRATADFLVNRARTLIYSTALPPPSIGAALKALELMDRELVGAAARQRADAARGAWASRSATCRSSRSSSASPRRRWRAAPRRSSRASSPRRSARRPSRTGTSRLRLVATAAHDPADLRRAGTVLYENVMSE